MRPEVIDGIDEATPQEMSPHPVDESARQVLVLGVHNQLAQLGPANDVGALADFLAVQKLGERDAHKSIALVEPDECVARLITQLGVVVGFQSRLIDRRLLLGFQPLEKSIDSPEIALLPLVGRVVVTLRALDLLAQEESGRARGQRHRIELEMGQYVVDRPVLLVRASGRHQIEDHVVPRAIGGELLAQPATESIAVNHPALVAPADQQDRPLGREVLGIVRVLQQIIDELVPLVGLSGLEERPSLLDVGNPAQQVKVGSPQVLFVGRRLCRIHTGFLPGSFQQPVDESPAPFDLALLGARSWTVSRGQPLTSNHDHE